MIDDEPSLLDVSKQFLELDRSLCVEGVSTADDALELIKDQDFDVIVSDYQMPDKDGIQLLNELRASGNRTPFILFTGKGREDVAIEALNAGADFYLQKGGDPKAQFAELKNMITKSAEKHRIEFDLKVNEEKFKNIFNSTNDSIHILGLDGRILEINDIGCHWLGYSKQEMLQKNLKDIDSEHYAIKIQDRIKEVMEKGFALFSSEWVSKDGRAIPVEISARRIEYAGRPAVLSVGRDVTDRRRAEVALRKSEEKYRQLVESSSDGIFTIDPSAKINWANDYAHELLGYSKSELPIALRKLVPIKYWPAAMRLFYGGLKGKVVTEPFELEVIAKNGERIPVSYKGTLLHDENGNVTNVLGVIREMRGSKKLEATLLRTKERIRSDGTADSFAFWELDMMAKFIFIKGDACNYFGLKAEELIGQSAFEFFKKDPETIVLIRRGLAGEEFSAEIQAKGRYWRTHYSPRRNKKGDISGLIAVSIDITERKQIEYSLQEVNRKLYLLSSITWHDTKNQLIVLAGHLKLLARKRPDLASDDHLLQAEATAERISAMIQFTKDYQDVGVQAPLMQDVRGLVESSSEDIPLGSIRLVNDVPKGTEVFADPLIAKVFHNLIDNAVRHGGKITTIRFFVEANDGGINIICEDDGIGIMPDRKGEFFTHGSGKGHGFGLFLSREILAITGIAITEEGKTGKGAKFVLTVPGEGLRMTNGRSVVTA